MIIQGVNVECNVSDSRIFKAYELGCQEIQRLSKDPEVTKLMQYEQIELYCSAVVKMVTELFGEESCKQIITNPFDFLLCVKVFVDISEVLGPAFKEVEKNTLKEFERAKEIEAKLAKYDISRVQ